MLDTDNFRRIMWVMYLCLIIYLGLRELCQIVFFSCCFFFCMSCFQQNISSKICSLNVTSRIKTKIFLKVVVTTLITFKNGEYKIYYGRHSLLPTLTTRELVSNNSFVLKQTMTCASAVKQMCSILHDSEYVSQYHHNPHYFLFLIHYLYSLTTVRVSKCFTLMLKRNSG